MQISPEWLHKQAAEIEALRKLLVLVRAERDDLAAGHYAAVTAEREIDLLRFVADAALVYFEHYMQDEAEDEADCVCGKEQHDRAVGLRDALRHAGLLA